MIGNKVTHLPRKATTTRIINKYQLPQNVLRPSCNSDGSAFVKKQDRVSDDQFLGPKNMMKMMSPDNSHLLGRPGGGLSQTSQCMAPAMEMMRPLTEDPDAPDITDVHKLCDNADFMNALGLLNTDFEMDREEGDVREAVKQVTSFIDATSRSVTRI